MKKHSGQRWKRHGFLLLTILLFLTAALSVAGTVYSKSTDTYQLHNVYLREQEQECLRQIKAVLQKYHCENGGLTMTKIIDKEGSRQYQVLLHHRRINDMTDTKKVELQRELEKIVFCQKDCSISYEFLP